LSGVVFFDDDANLLRFVRRIRELSLRTRAEQSRLGQAIVYPGRGSEEDEADWPTAIGIDARALEYFDRGSLDFLRQKYEAIPEQAVGAVFFEQETTEDTEGDFVGAWLSYLQEHKALGDDSWFANSEQDQARLREFRHALPVLMNEWFARHKQRKVSTDMAVPDDEFPGMLRFYDESLRTTDLRYTIFGHIGDNHVHVNILPRNDEEGARARAIYLEFLKRAVSVGGTLSAEHGIGKLKRDYLKLFYSEQHLREMAALKLAFDPAGILGRGNMFSEALLS
jgi:D-lactate dehydrogenase (cytochrome)